MKRAIALLLVVLMLLTGCASQPVQETVPAASLPVENEAISVPPLVDEPETIEQGAPIFPEDVEPNFS